MRLYYIPLVLAFLGCFVAAGAEISLMVLYPDVSDVRRFVIGWPYIVGGGVVAIVNTWLWHELRTTWRMRHSDDD